MKKTLLFLFAFVWVIFLSGCSTNEAITCYLPSVKITSNSPLVPGATLLLTTPTGHESDLKYNWSGPNNFQSNLQNPTITSITTSMAGEYKLKTTKGICESNESSVLVEINAPNIPCNPNKNTIVLSENSKIDFNSVYSYKANDEFILTAGSLQADLRIEFARYVTPTPGIYTICSDCPTSSMKSNEVCVSLNYVEYSHARSGSVYISSLNGKLNAIFCNVIFQQSPFTFNSSANITEN